MQAIYIDLKSDLRQIIEGIRAIPTASCSSTGNGYTCIPAPGHNFRVRRRGDKPVTCNIFYATETHLMAITAINGMVSVPYAEVVDIAQIEA